MAFDQREPLWEQEPPPDVWPHETRDLTNVEPYYEDERTPFATYLEELPPVEPYGYEEEPARNWRPNPRAIDVENPQRPMTPWLSGVIMPDGGGAPFTPPEVVYDLAQRRMAFNEARIAEAEDPAGLAQNYNYQALKPWEARPWVRDSVENSQPWPPDEDARLARWRDQVFAWYGVTPSAARFLGQVGLTGPEPGAPPKVSSYYYPGANTIELNVPFASVLMHEYAHAADPRLQPGNSRDAYPPAFVAGLDQLYQDPSDAARYYRMAVERYPGRGSVYTNPTETYAQIAAESAMLKPYKIPPYLTPFYDYLFGDQRGGR